MDEVDMCDFDFRRLDDSLEVTRWRTERLVTLGFELREAVGLALSPIDVHELERLVGKGCPPEVAVRIAA
jgi:hypothetical protein